MKDHLHRLFDVPSVPGIALAVGLMLVALCKWSTVKNHPRPQAFVLLCGPCLLLLISAVAPAMTQPTCISIVFGALIALSFMAYMGYLNLQERRPVNLILGIAAIGLYVLVALASLMRGIDHTFGMGPR